MLTVFLWILLLSAILLLIVVASPLRFSGRLLFNRPDDFDFEFAGSYIHPVIFRFEYSSKDARPRAALFGFAIKKRVKKKKKSGVDDDAGAKRVDDDKIKTERADNVNTKRVDSVDTKHADSVDAKPVDGDSVNTKPADGVNAGDDTGRKIDGSEGKPAVKIKKPKKDPIRSRIKKRIAAIKKHIAYRLINDKPFRKKMLKWLRRLPRRLFRLISIDTLKLHAKVGYHNPASLGKLYGYFTAARSAFELRNTSVDMMMEPVFTEECLEIDTELKIRTRISVLLWYLLLIRFTFPGLDNAPPNKKRPLRSVL